MVYAMAFEGTEHVFGAVVLVEILLVVLQFRLVVLEVLLCGLELRAGGGYGRGLGRVRVWVGEDPILDKQDAERAQFVVNPVSEGLGQVFFEFVYCEDDG